MSFLNTSNDSWVATTMAQPATFNQSVVISSNSAGFVGEALPVSEADGTLILHDQTTLEVFSLGFFITADPTPKCSAGLSGTHS
jgi:hypothetical protein